MKNKNIKILIILSIILLFIGIIIFCINKNIKNDTYQIKNKTYYEVTLKENNYYIANSIKSVDVYFDYYIKNNIKKNISYNITATLKSYADSGTKLIWTKDFILEKTNNIKQKEININKNYNLDYQYYVNYVKSFQEYYNIKTESYLYVKLNINVNNENKSYVLITIPINENVIEITMKEENENNNKNVNINKIQIISFIIIVIILLTIRICFNKDSENNLLKEYKDIIINIKNKPNLDENNIIYLNSLKDLISIAINNNINIFSYSNNYYIIIDNTYYIYILKK